MSIKRFFCGVLAAVVLVASAPIATAPVEAKTYASDGQAKQEVAVKKSSKVTLKAQKKKAKVTIKKVSGASGYEVQYATNKKMTKGKKTKTTKKTSYTIKKLTSGKTYYVRTRTYQTVKYEDANGKIKTMKIYSKWTSIKKVKVK